MMDSYIGTSIRRYLCKGVEHCPGVLASLSPFPNVDCCNCCCYTTLVGGADGSPLHANPSRSLCSSQGRERETLRQRPAKSKKEKKRHVTTPRTVATDAITILQVGVCRGLIVFVAFTHVTVSPFSTKFVVVVGLQKKGVSTFMEGGCKVLPVLPRVLSFDINSILFSRVRLLSNEGLR